MAEKLEDINMSPNTAWKKEQVDYSFEQENLGIKPLIRKISYLYNAVTTTIVNYFNQKLGGSLK